MGVLGIGDGEARKALKETRSALDQAHGDPVDHGVVGNSATKIVQNLLDLGIDGKGPFDSAETVAARALRKHPDPEDAVAAIVRTHIAMGGAEGFATSVGGFFTLPVALPVNVLAFYLLATRMTASIASVRGYDLSDPKIRTAVLLTLVGAEADDLLAKAGMVAPTGAITSLAAERLPGPALMVVNKAVGFRLLATAGKKTFSRFGRNVPLVGGAVGGGLDAWLMKRVSDNAREEFPRRTLRIAAD